MIALILLVTYFIIPSEAQMERTVVIEASAEKVFPHVSSLKKMQDWSPWVGIDPNAEYTFEGPDSGVGAKMSWSSEDPNVGNGKQEIVEVVEFSKVNTKMEFEGFGGETHSAILLEPEGEGTKVTWTYESTDQNGIARFFMLGVDGMLGPSYEEGLGKLKSLVESMPDEEPEMMEMPMEETDTTAVDTQ